MKPARNYLWLIIISFFFIIGCQKDNSEGPSKRNCGENKLDANFLHNNKALLISPYKWQIMQSVNPPLNKIDQMEGIKKQLENKGYEVTYLSNQNEQEQNIDLNTFKSFSSYGVVVIEGHGTLIEYGNDIAIGTGIHVTDNPDPQLKADLEAGLIATDGITYAVLTGWFNKYYPDPLEKTLIYISGCRSFKNNSLYEIFVGTENENKTSTFFGYNDKIDAGVAAAIGIKLFGLMLSNIYNVGESYRYLVENPPIEFCNGNISCENLIMLETNRLRNAGDNEINLVSYSNAFGPACWLESWETAVKGTYEVVLGWMENGPDSIPSDEGAWKLLDTVNNFEEECNAPGPNRAHIINYNGGKALKLESFLYSYSCANNIWVDLMITVGIPLVPELSFSFIEEGYLNNPESSEWGCLLPPCGDVNYIVLFDNYGNQLVYVLQRPSNEIPHQFKHYLEVHLNNVDDSNQYTTFPFEDFSRIDGFVPSGAEITRIAIGIVEDGWMIIDELTFR
jgi:hypothetical protein